MSHILINLGPIQNWYDPFSAQKPFTLFVNPALVTRVAVSLSTAPATQFRHWALSVLLPYLGLDL